MFAASSGLLLDLEEEIDFPSGLLELIKLTQDEEHIHKFTAVDTEFNMTSREEYLAISDVTAPVINQFFTYNSEAGSITVSINVSDDSGSVITVAYLYSREHDELIHSRGIPLTIGVGNATCTNLDIERIYLSNRVIHPGLGVKLEK